MDADFWHDRWQQKEIGFHEGRTNNLLETHLDKMLLPENARIFIPLCGKTRDIAWLLAQGYSVVGAELSGTAVEELFGDLGLEPKHSPKGDLGKMSAPSLDIYVGDIFHMTREILGPVDMVYDRAALVALPDSMRPDYAKHLVDISQRAPQFLICFDYDQTVMPGPPFSVNEGEVHTHYSAVYSVEKIAEREIGGGLKGYCPAVETAWKLAPDMRRSD